MCLMLGSGAPKWFWSEVVTICYLINLTPIILNGDIPH